MINRKQIILTAIIMAAACFITACSDTAETPVLVTETTSVETETEKALPDLPEINYDGAEFRILVPEPGAGDWQDWGSRDVIAEEQNGETINDAVYSRNLYVEDKYGVNITGISKTDLANLTKKMVLAGTDDYHVVTNYVKSMISTITAGYLVDLNTVEYMDLSQPWYDQQCVKENTIMGKIYFVTGDMILIDDDATAALLFNKKLLSDYNLESPYNYVNKNEWTYETFCSMWQNMGNDLNGNSKVDADDQFGFIWQNDATIAFFHALNGRIASLDSDGFPVYNLENEACMNALTAVSKYLYNTDLVINLHDYSSTYKNIYHELQDPIFTQNRALFNWVRMRVVENYRNMDADFGIMPMPKYDSNQETYYHTVNSNTCNTIEIPNSSLVDTEYVGIIIEAMSAESAYTVKEAYYEINLGTKITRDEESKAMLDIIFSTRIYDIGEIYNWGGIGDSIRGIMQKKSSDFASMITKANINVIKQLDKFIETFEKIT